MNAAPIPPQIAAIERPVESLWRYYLIKAALTVAGFPVMLPLLYFRYHTMRYKFDAEGIHMSWGILFRHQIILNYSRIQDIHLQSNFIERWLGLARIEIQTAAGSSGTEMTLEGIADHAGMRDFLYSRMRGARSEKIQPQDEQAPLASALEEIAAELRTIRKLIQEQRPRA